MLEMHLRQPGFTYSACGPFAKSKEKIQKFKETGDSRYIYQNELDKACFQNDMVYGDFKDLASDKILHKKALNIAINPKCDEYQHGLPSMVYTFFDKKISVSGIKDENMSDQQFVEELHKPINRKCNKEKVQ